MIKDVIIYGDNTVGPTGTLPRIGLARKAALQNRGSGLMPSESRETTPSYPNPFGCSDRYWRWLMRQTCITGGMFRIAAVAGGIFEVVSLMAPSTLYYPRNPYPFWSLFFLSAFYVIGHFASKFARIGLRWQEDGFPPP